MATFKTWLEGLEDGIKIPLPSVQQTHDFDCGAACLRSICEFFKCGPENQEEFIKACKTDPKKGTNPEDMLRAARQFGLSAKPMSGMKLDQLKEYIDLQRPVIVCMQAWDDDEKYDNNEDGHYVVAIGYDDKNIYFEDPVLENERGVLSQKEFVKRWHDKDAEGRKYIRFGLALWKPMGWEQPEIQKVDKKKKIQ